MALTPPLDPAYQPVVSIDKPGDSADEHAQDLVSSPPRGTITQDATNSQHVAATGYSEPATPGELDDVDIRCSARLILEAKLQIKPVLGAKDIVALCMLFCGSSGRAYLEYGSGGSTRVSSASKILHDSGGGQQSVLVVESSHKFLANLVDQIASDADRLQPGTPPLMLTTAPLLGPLRGWSHPQGAKIVRNKNGVPSSSGKNLYMYSYPVYSKAGQEMMRQSALLAPPDSPLRPGWPERVFGRPASRQDKDVPEFVLVDGRFRVACVLRVIKEWGDVPLILLDDFNERQRSYGSVLRFAKPWLGLDTFVRQGAASIMKVANDGTTATAHRKPVSAEELRKHVQEPLSQLPVVGADKAKEYADKEVPKFVARVLRDLGPTPSGYITEQSFHNPNERLDMPSLGLQRGLWLRGLPKGQRDEAALDAAIDAFSFISQ